MNGWFLWLRDLDRSKPCLRATVAFSGASAKGKLTTAASFPSARTATPFSSGFPFEPPGVIRFSHTERRASSQRWEQHPGIFVLVEVLFVDIATCLQFLFMHIYRHLSAFLVSAYIQVLQVIVPGADALG